MPLRLALMLQGLLIGATAVYVFVALTTTGTARAGGWLFAAAFAALWAAASWASLPARSDVDPGTTRVRGSWPLVALLCVPAPLAVAGVAMWGVGLLIGPGTDAPQASGFFVVMAIGAIGALPTGWRAVTGRLHVPRVDLDEDGLHYRGGRTLRSIPWSRVRSVALNSQHTRLVVRTTDGTDPLAVPTLAFDVAPTRLCEVVERARTTGSGGPPEHRLRRRPGRRG